MNTGMEYLRTVPVSKAQAYAEVVVRVDKVLEMLPSISRTFI